VLAFHAGKLLAQNPSVCNLLGVYVIVSAALIAQGTQ
jgi:hypothetical protein